MQRSMRKDYANGVNGDSEPLNLDRDAVVVGGGFAGEDQGADSGRHSLMRAWAVALCDHSRFEDQRHLFAVSIEPI